MGTNAFSYLCFLSKMLFKRRKHSFLAILRGSLVSQNWNLVLARPYFNTKIFISDTTNEKYRKAEYVQRRVCLVNVESSLHENEKSVLAVLFIAYSIRAVV